MSNWCVNVYSQWTEGSIFCYRRGCNCDGCYVQEILETPCVMKKAVLTLVKEYGAPSNGEDELTETQQKIILAILAGANTKEEIAEKVNVTTGVVQNCLCDMYKLAEADGIVYTTHKYKLNTFINWVRKGEL